MFFKGMRARACMQMPQGEKGRPRLLPQSSSITRGGRGLIRKEHFTPPLTPGSPGTQRNEVLPPRAAWAANPIMGAGGGRGVGGRVDEASCSRISRNPVILSAPNCSAVDELRRPSTTTTTTTTTALPLTRSYPEIPRGL